MNRTQINGSKRELTAGDKHFYLAMIADMKAEHERALREKNEMIRYYARAAETATRRKEQAIRNAERRAKLNLSYALLLIAGMALIPWALWLVDTAFKSFWLWAN